MDINAPIDKIYETLQNIQNYEKFISTVKSVSIYQQAELTTSAEFCLSRFRLKMNIIHSFNPIQVFKASI